MTKHPEFIPLPGYTEYPVEEMTRRAAGFYDEMKRRRTVRDFSNRPVPRAIIDACFAAAGIGAQRREPCSRGTSWSSPTRRSSAEIRDAAEEEEREFYRHKAPQEWLDALAPLGTDEHKPFLETAPCLIAIFAETYGVLPDGAEGQALLRAGVGRHRDRPPDRRPPPRRPRLAHPHPEPDGLPERNPRPARPASGRSCCWSSATRPPMRPCPAIGRNSLEDIATFL